MKARLPFTERLRGAMRDCGKTRYTISQETGIDQGVLSRFADGKTIRSRTLDRLVEYLEFDRCPRCGGVLETP